jgi:hypothetical protein
LDLSRLIVSRRGDMWPFSPGLDALRPEERDSRPSRKMALGRFRHNTLFYHRYWTQFFSVTRPDLSRLAVFIRSEKEACTLTALVRELIRSRLRSGPQLTGDASVRVRRDTPSVRFWDPAETWGAGDRAIFAIPSPALGRTYVPQIGVITRVEGEVFTVSIDGLSELRTYRKGEPTDAVGRQVSTGDLDALFKSDEEEQQVDYVLWRYGDTLAEQVLSALLADDRFLHLHALWYLRALSPSLSETQVVTLARGLFAYTDKPVPIDTLVPLVDPPLPEGPPGLFGLLRTLLAHPALFQKVEMNLEPLWTLAGPPPGRWIARHAAYDPETFKVLCMPWEVIDLDAAQRLWECHLFRAVVTGESETQHPH